MPPKAPSPRALRALPSLRRLLGCLSAGNDNQVNFKELIYAASLFCSGELHEKLQSKVGPCAGR